MTHYIRIAPANLARLWADRSLTRADIAALLGITPHALTARIKAHGIPLRGKDNTKKRRITDDAEFAEFWRAGVSNSELAAHYGVVMRTIINTRDRLGLPPRQQGSRPRATILGVRMAKAAKVTQAQLGFAEMVDLKSKLWWDINK